MKVSIYKKPVTIFLVVCSLALTGKAQVQLGVKGGLNISEMLTSGNPITLVEGNAQNMRYFPNTTVHGGVFLSLPLGKKWVFQPELVYSSQGATARPEKDYLVSATEDYRLGYLNLPLLIKYKLPVGFFVETGPQVGFLLSAKTNETMVGDVNTVRYNIKNQLKSTDLSWTLGAGYCSPFNVGFDVRYNLGLSNINQATAEGLANAPIPNGTIKNSVVQIGVFYIFGKRTFNPPGVEE
ncbi:porin family protein [Flavitalea sp. BT771]|uniref:porin family protein n=1 Tax=Flavitalea sp. BT771 TaxID=3063329 RepID=UPI0026E37AAD|nr:porin family protein [Flavitalea sp. BT771]MDO6433483.1 porin family protein [Flavitalea sp. BT771]MDV6222612.1 porin family protein [Flavitalea sp. BT771]